jgi:hypothetical protein
LVLSSPSWVARKAVKSWFKKVCSGGSQFLSPHSARCRPLRMLVDMSFSCPDSLSLTRPLIFSSQLVDGVDPSQGEEANQFWSLLPLVESSQDCVNERGGESPVERTTAQSNKLQDANRRRGFHK